MSGFLPRREYYRAVIAVIALYALALQIVLGGVMIAQSFGSTGVICLHDAGSSDSDLGKQQPAHGCPDCCTPAHMPASPAPPLLTSAEVEWPQLRGVIVSWRPEVAASPRAPPGIDASARAPPFV